MRRPGLLGSWLLLGGLLAWGAPGAAASGVETPEAGAACQPSLFLAGDAIIVRPWSQTRDPSFLALVESIRAADAAIVNLETVIHTFRGYPQAQSGGTWMSSPPEIAQELAWAGIDLVVHANNHAFDYGSIGVLETLEHTAQAGLVLAGSGPDLQAARAPARFDSRGGRVALVAMASTYVSYGAASRSRPDVHGRPGLNPLAIVRDTEVTITPEMARALARAARWVGREGRRFGGERFYLGGTAFRVGEAFSIESEPRPLREDREGNLAAIRRAAAEADIVVVSLHDHEQGPWLPGFVRDAIEAGADVFFVEGPHEVRAVAFVEGRPVFYGMGDFVFEPDYIERLPSMAYERVGLGDEATSADVLARSTELGKRKEVSTRAAYESFATQLCFRDGRVAELHLLPLDLRYDGPASERGRPHLADPTLGRAILQRVAEVSRPLGTRIDYVEDGNYARVQPPLGD